LTVPGVKVSKFEVTLSATATPLGSRATPATKTNSPTIAFRGRTERIRLLVRSTATTSPRDDLA
jgi:hypothetical protein